MKDSNMGNLNHVDDTRSHNPDSVWTDVTPPQDNTNRGRRGSSGLNFEETSSENDDGNGQTAGRCCSISKAVHWVDYQWTGSEMSRIGYQDCESRFSFECK